MTPSADTAVAPAERTLAGGPVAGAHNTPGTARRRVAGWLVWVIHGYQLARSGRPTGCRFLPTCSHYAIEAIDQYGAVRGSALAVRRLLRCNPWGGHGVDPVPDRRTPCSR